jgi:hypothetical protein
MTKKPSQLLLLLLSAFALVASGQDAALPEADAKAYARIDITDVGFETLSEIQNTPGLDWWVELGDHLLVLGEQEVLAPLTRRHDVTVLAVSPSPDRLRFLRFAHPGSALAHLDADVLARGGRFVLIQGRSAQPPDLPLDGHAALLPFLPNQILARQWANQPRSRASRSPRAETQTVVDEVDAQRWYNDVVTLATWNRYTHGDEIDDARDWLVQSFSALPGLSVTTQSFSVGATTTENVIATLTGSARPDEWYVLGGHYDSTSENPAGAGAPGAEDNASGCAGILEMARIFTAYPPAATMIFMCYSGEEQGLHGSEHHVSTLVNAGDVDKVVLMLDMDMIGYTADADLDCLLETNASHTAWHQTFADAAAAYTSLRILTVDFAFGSDHVSYLNQGIAAMLTIENDWDIYPHYHSSTDLPGEVSLDMGSETLRMNVAVFQELAGSMGIFSDGFESGDTSRWTTP